MLASEKKGLGTAAKRKAPRLGGLLGRHAPKILTRLVRKVLVSTSGRQRRDSGAERDETFFALDCESRSGTLPATWVPFS